MKPTSTVVENSSPDGLRWRLVARVLLFFLLAAPAQSADQSDIDRKVLATLEVLEREAPESSALLHKAVAVLVFPDVYKAGFGIGGEYGEGALLVDGETLAYYSTSGASFGMQLGVQSKSEVILFMSKTALRDFRRSKGWEAGVDGRVALVTEGTGAEIDTRTIDQPIIGFVFSNKGLMYNLTFEGKKITPLER